ncbi:MAG: VTT domain-containing protein [Candidatus Woesebacteria bacterium]
MSRKLIGAATILIALGLIVVLQTFFPEEYVQRVVFAAGPFAPLVFIAISILINIFLPFLAPPMVYVGYYAFNRNVVFYASIASFICFFTNFWIARWWGRVLVERLVGKKAMQTVDRMGHRYGVVTLFFLRVFQGGIHDIISYVGGLTDMKFTPYIVTSIIGLIPGAIIWYIISVFAHNSLQFFVISTITSLVLSTIFIGATVVYERVKKPRRRHSNRATL